MRNLKRGKEMNNKEFFDLVSNMRAKQKEYFKYRNNTLLKESKALEKQVDDEISRVNDVLSKRKEPSLFE